MREISGFSSARHYQLAYDWLTSGFSLQILLWLLHCILCSPRFCISGHLHNSIILIWSSMKRGLHAWQCKNGAPPVPLRGELSPGRILWSEHQHFPHFLCLKTFFNLPYSLIKYNFVFLVSSLKESYRTQNSLELKFLSRSSPPFYAKQRTLSLEEKMDIKGLIIPSSQLVQPLADLQNSLPQLV